MPVLDPETYSSGTVPRITDSRRTLLVKLILAEGGGGGGGGGGGIDLFQGHYGANVPNFTPDHFPVMARDQDAPNVLWWYDGVSWQ